MHGKKVKIPALRAKAVPKTSHTCWQGPLHNTVLCLASPRTLVFTMKGQTGRYIATSGANLTGYGLIWEPHGTPG